MALKVQIGGSDSTGRIFVGEDKVLRFEVLDSAEAPVDIAGWGISFVVRHVTSETTALVTKTAAITGAFNASRSVNTQRAVITLSDDDLSATKFTRSGTHVYSLKRVDDASETIINYGNFVIEMATQT